MGNRVAASPTAREREVARLIKLGLTNREIASRLRISERTVAAHIQNILNKLGASNRAQIAAWSAENSTPAELATTLDQPVTSHVSHASPIAAQRVPPPPSSSGRRGLLVAAGLLLSLLLPADHAIQPLSAAAAVSSHRGDLVYEAHFQPDGRDFSLRYVIGNADASAVRFVNGGVEYSVLKLGGNTGNRLALYPMAAYFAEYEVSVVPKSDVTFWISFNSDSSSRQHLLEIDTAIETMQLQFFIYGELPSLPLGPQVAIDGLQSGRHVAISVLVQPPIYRVFMNGVRVIDVNHASSRSRQSPSFAIFGNGTGTVRLSAIRVYKVD